MDLDHLYDFYQWYIRGRSKRVYVLFHAWEYSVAGLVALASVFFHPFFLAAVLAHLAHLAADQVHNRLPPFAYSIVYRLVKRFDTAFIAPRYNVMYSYRGWPQLVPFGGRLTPWYRRRIEPWFEKRVRRAARIQADAYPSDD